MNLRLLLCLLLGALLVATPLHATILFAGGEDSDFTLNAGMYMTTSGASTGYSRGSLSISFGGSSTSAAALHDYAETPTFTANSTLWVHANRLDNAQNLATTLVLGVFSPDGVMRLALRGTGTSGQYKISTVNASGTFTDLVTMSSACFGASNKAFDLYINYATSGEVTLYCGGVSYADYTGDVTTNGATQINQLMLLGTGVNGTNSLWSEVIVATTDTRNMRLVTLSPSANGNAHTFDTGAASNVNETVLNTSTVDASGTSGQVQQYTVGSLPSGLWQVQAVVVSGLAQVDTTGPQHVQAMVRTGGSDYSSSNLSPPQGSWGNVSRIWATNPNTGVAWTTGDLSTGFNIGFSSQN